MNTFSRKNIRAVS